MSKPATSPQEVLLGVWWYAMLTLAERRNDKYWVGKLDGLRVALAGTDLALYAYVKDITY